MPLAVTVCVGGRVEAGELMELQAPAPVWEHTASGGNGAVLPYPKHHVPKASNTWTLECNIASQTTATVHTAWQTHSSPIQEDTCVSPPTP
jgi:hypothetical protein